MEKRVHIGSMLKSPFWTRCSQEKLGNEEENTAEVTEDTPQAPPFIEKGKPTIWHADEALAMVQYKKLR